MNIPIFTPEEIHGIDEKGKRLTIGSLTFRDGLLPFNVGVRKLTPTYGLSY
jgi:hypothetical protein